jgi:hypothetical protein
VSFRAKAPLRGTSPGEEREMTLWRPQRWTSGAACLSVTQLLSDQCKAPLGEAFGAPSKTRPGIPTSVYGDLVLWRYEIMATRKMTFSVPEELAMQFRRRVASRDRSRFVSEALAARLEQCDAALIRACEIANQDQDVAAIEKELDGLCDEMAEPWK